MIILIATIFVGDPRIHFGTFRFNIGSTFTAVLRRINSNLSIPMCSSVYRRLGAKGSYLTLVRVADRIL